MVAGLNAWVNTTGGAAVTVNVALAVPVVVALDVIAPVVNGAAPTVIDVTSAVIWQVAPAANVPPVIDRRAILLPRVAPTQVVDWLASVVWVTPVGKLLFNAIVDSSRSDPALEMSMVMIDVPPCAIVLGVKDVDKVGVGAAVTVRLALGNDPPVPKDVTKAPVALLTKPVFRPRTVTEISHVAPAATVPPASEMLVAPAAAVNVPPQVLDTAGVGATIRPDPSVLLKLIVLAAIRPAVLSMLKVMTDVPPCTIVVGANAWAVTGSGVFVTVNVAAAVPLLPSDDVRLPVVLGYDPSATEMTVAVIAQLPLAGTVPPE